MILKDRYGNALGKIDEQGSRKTAYDRYGNRVGQYDSNTDKTYDRWGNVVAQGDILAGMIR